MSESDRSPVPEQTPLRERPAVAYAPNAELARVMGNAVLEAQAHSAGMKALYDQVCAMTHAPKKSWGLGLVEEYERHVKRIAESVLPDARVVVESMG